MVPAIELERRIPRTGMFCNIISKFHYAQEPHPVVLFVINKGSKVSFYGAVLPLSLAVRLRVEGSREPLFNAQEVVQGGPELGREY